MKQEIDGEQTGLSPDDVNEPLSGEKEVIAPLRRRHRGPARENRQYQKMPGIKAFPWQGRKNSQGGLGTSGLRST